MRRTFGTLAAARAWRQEAAVALRARRLAAPSDRRLDEAAEAWLEAARAGVVRTRSGHRYKPSAIRSYEATLKRYILPCLGNLRLSALTRGHLQELVDELVSRGLSASTVANALLPLRAIYRRAVDREEIAHNPTRRLALPRDRRRRERIAEPREIEPLLAALPGDLRVLWAAALFTGLRRGELQALRWEAVDLEREVLRVEASWDRIEGLVAPKSRSGERTVPLIAALRGELLAHRIRQGSGGRGFVFSGDGATPRDFTRALRAAQRAWRGAGIRPVGFHECRHTFASFMIAAGVNAKALSAYMGHSSITVTLDRYGHLLPGSERQAAALLDAFLEHDHGALGRGGGAICRR